MAAVAALIPENAAEAEIAITAIATDFHAKDALAAASRPNLTIDALKNLRAMTASMSRQSQNAIRTLRLMQAERRKLENALYPAAMERSGHWFKDASLMVAGPSPIAIPPPTEPTGELPRQALARMDAAEQFAARHPSQAAAIRAHGGVPPNCDFTPPDPKLVAFIVASRSPLLQELDDPSPTLPLPLREGAGGGGDTSHPCSLPLWRTKAGVRCFAHEPLHCFARHRRPAPRHRPRRDFAPDRGRR
jgi:hypothetical protein